MTNDELQQRIDSSPALKQAAEQLKDEIAFRADASMQFDPLLIVMIISIIVQIIIHCRQSRKSEAVRQDMRELRTLPAYKLLRLRRRLNKLWREHTDGTHALNVFTAAVFELSETADDAAIDELLRLAEETGAA